MERIKYKGYFIDKTEHGWRICKEDDIDIHTHLRNLNPSYKLIDNVINHKIPRRCGLYYIQSHIRLADNEEYKQKLQQTCGKPTPLGVGWIAHLFYSLMCMLLLILYTYCDIVDVWKIIIDIQTQQYL